MSLQSKRWSFAKLYFIYGSDDHPSLTHRCLHDEWLWKREFSSCFLWWWRGRCIFKDDDLEARAWKDSLFQKKDPPTFPLRYFFPWVLLLHKTDCNFISFAFFLLQFPLEKVCREDRAEYKKLQSGPLFVKQERESFYSNQRTRILFQVYNSSEVTLVFREKFSLQKSRSRQHRRNGRKILCPPVLGSLASVIIILCFGRLLSRSRTLLSRKRCILRCQELPK